LHTTNPLQITRPSHPPEQIRTIEEADEEKSITAPSSEQSRVNLRSSNYCVVVLALKIALAIVVVLALKIPLATVVAGAHQYAEVLKCSLTNLGRKIQRTIIQAPKIMKFSKPFS